MTRQYHRETSQPNEARPYQSFASLRLAVPRLNVTKVHVAIPLHAVTILSHSCAGPSNTIPCHRRTQHHFAIPPRCQTVLNYTIALHSTAIRHVTEAVLYDTRLCYTFALHNRSIQHHRFTGITIQIASTLSMGKLHSKPLHCYTVARQDLPSPYHSNTERNFT